MRYIISSIWTYGMLHTIMFSSWTGPSWSYGSWIYNYLCNQYLSPLNLSSNPVHGEVFSIQHYVIKFVSDVCQVGDFLRVIRLSSTNKTYRHDITEILLKVALNTININQPTFMHVHIFFIFFMLFFKKDYNSKDLPQNCIAMLQTSGTSSISCT